MIYPINHLPDKVPIGIQTEQGVEVIGFDLKPWLDAFPDMDFTVWHTRPGEKEAYPVKDRMMVGTVLYWHPDGYDTAIAGDGKVEIAGVGENRRKLSGYVPTDIQVTSMVMTKEPGENTVPWYEKVIDAATKIAADVDVGAGGLYLVTATHKDSPYISYADRGQAEIREAVAAGKTCFLVADGRVYTYFGDTHNPEGDCPTFIAASEYDRDKGIVYWQAQVLLDGRVSTNGYNPAKTPNPYKLTIGGKTYDGSGAVEVEIPDVFVISIKEGVLDRTPAEIASAIEAARPCILVRWSGENALDKATVYTYSGRQKDKQGRAGYAFTASAYEEKNVGIQIPTVYVYDDGTSSTIVVTARTPNPYALTIKQNGVTSSYNGSSAFTLDLAGGGGNVEVDDSLTKANAAADAKVVGDRLTSLSEEMAENDLPTVYYGGDLPQIKTEQIMSLRIVSKTMDVKGYCETKAQGNSSMNFPKKNQTTKIFADVACEEKLKLAFRNWGKQQKFCLKANWNDLSHARNVVSARIWGDMVRTRPDFDSIPELMRTSPNFGAIDGFPVRVFAAGTYQGRYAFNIPKDKWMSNMDDENPNHCILCGEDYGSGCFRAPALIDGNDWTDEIHDTVPDSIKTRWNECITFVQTSTDEEFKANLHQYFNVPSLIDYHIFGLVSCHLDGFGKNQLFMTYDGQVWYASVYDMDATWGNHYMGTKLVGADYARTAYEDYVSSASSGNGNLLYVRLEALFAEEIKARWNDVKTTSLALDNILNRFEQWASICPPWIVAEDYAETTAEGAFVDMPGQDYNNIQQIRAFAKARHAWTETYINGEPTVNLWNVGERTYKLLPFSATKDKVPNYEVGLDEFALTGSRIGYMTGNRQIEHTIDGNNITFKPLESGVGLFMPVALTPGKTYRLRFTTSDATGTMAVTWYDDTIKYVANTGALTPNNGLSYEGTFVAANYPNFAITAVAAGTTIPETITFSDVSLVELL